MKYPEFVGKLKSQTAKLEHERKLSLSIEICKKLFFDYQQFANENNWGNPDLLLDAINLSQKALIREIETTQAKSLLVKIDEISPDAEEFTDASYALNACTAVYETLEFILDNKSEHIYNIATYLTDTVYLKIKEKVDLTDDQVDNHPLMIETRRFLLEATR